MGEFTLIYQKIVGKYRFKCWILEIYEMVGVGFGTACEDGFNRLENKQDQTIDKISDLGKELGDKIDQVGDKVDQSRIEISSDIHSLRDDFNTLFDARISKMEYELTEIKDKIVVLESSSSYNLTDKRKT